MRIVVSLASQRLDLFDDQDNLVRSWPVSTAANGAGEQAGSYCTPRGRHVIRAKIGAGLPINTVFKARRPTGEVYSPALAEKEPGRDWILTRILWLSGKEPGFNRLGDCDSMRRYIYIHGTPDELFLQRPCSHGCIRMRNADVVELFELAPTLTPVQVIES